MSNIAAYMLESLITLALSVLVGLCVGILIMLVNWLIQLVS